MASIYQKLTDRTELEVAPASGDLLHVVDISDTSDSAEGTSKKIEVQTLLTGVHSVTEKTTPVDADEIGLIDSAASWVLKKLTFLGLKLTLYAGIKPAEGTMWNGKISPTVASNNITLALKTLAGNNPSASEPVYITIGGSVRTITSALSVTKNAGTNWFDAGSVELATKEIDYFAYLGYNATDGVTIGFSRIPGANQYSDFSATTTNEKYCAISTITNASATDYYSVIGRFAATLSAGAGYTWTVPTFISINLIQRPIFETRWLTWVSVLTASGGTAPTYTLEFINIYKLTGNKLNFFSTWENSSGGTAGSGSVDLYASFPFIISTNITDQVNRGCIGSGITSASISNSLVLLKRTTNIFAMVIPAGINMTAANQASTARYVSLNGNFSI